MRPPDVTTVSFRPVGARQSAWALLWAVLCVAPVSFAQPRVDGAQPPGSSFSTNSSSWEGLSEFVRLAEERIGSERVAVRAVLDFDALEPRDAVVVLHPEVRLDGDTLTRFLAGGGRVAIVDDFGSSPEFLARFDVRRVPPPLDPALVVDHNPNLAIAVPVDHELEGAQRGRHPMTEGVDLVVTNHASALSHPALTPILEIEGASGIALPIAVTGVIQKNGRLVVVGDPSIFINLMLRYPGNRAFATGLVDYLQARDGGGPRGRLFIVSGHFSQRGSFGKQTLADELQERFRALRTALADVDEQGLPAELALLLAVLGALWLVRFEVFEHLKATVRSTPRFARLAPVAAQSGLSGRAALLSAPSTTPLLGLLELGAALEESLAERLGTPVLPKDAAELRNRLSDAGMSPVDAGALLRSLEELGSYRHLATTGKRLRTSERELKRIHGEVKSMLSIIQRAARRPES